MADNRQLGWISNFCLDDIYHGQLCIRTYNFNKLVKSGIQQKLNILNHRKNIEKRFLSISRKQTIGKTSGGGGYPTITAGPAYYVLHPHKGITICVFF